ncbi:MAG: ATP-binding protein [Bryobacteraceae bacterium]
MRSLFVKILLWCLATLTVCLAGSFFSAQFRRFPERHNDFFSRFLAFQLEEARRIYEKSGREALQQHLTHLQKHFPGQYSLVNDKGVDLVSGEHRSPEIYNTPLPRHWRTGRDFVAISWPAADKKYFLLVNAIVPAGPPTSVPYYLWVVVVAVAFCYIITVRIVSPLRTLGQTVEAFGSGDLRVRAQAYGNDELSKLARTFNLMADRIETLLTAERRLLQDVSHELRSPLARLKFAAELARTSKDRSRSMDRIEKEIDRLSSLVSELLQVTRAENDPESRHLYEIALADLLHDVLDDSAMESEIRHCRLRLTIASGLQLLGDRELLRRAVENVLRNAIRYAPEGSDIEVSLTRNDAYAIISVRDFGPGVPDESLQNLFKPFFRVEADRNRNKGGGVGLGLSIAERAVAVHGGRIRVRNASPGLLVEIVLPVISTPALVNA